jgi:DNA-binding transcriptional ArsR family regulator
MAKKRRRAGRASRKSTGSLKDKLVKGLNHPVRVNALTILSERVACPKEISEQLEVKLSNVAYHVRVLEELGLVEITEEESVRGAVAHFYKAIDLQALDNQVWERLDPKVRSAFSGYILEALIADAARSVAAGVIDLRNDRRLIHRPMLLDEEGWRQVAEIQEEANKMITKAEAAAAKRINGGTGNSIRAVAALLCFEVPAESK